MTDPEGRPGVEIDAIDGVVPRTVVEPDTPEALARVLARATGDRRATVLRGGGTKLGWGRVPAAVDLVIGTARLGTLVAHRHGDLTATAQAGLSLVALNQELARHGQCLPVDSAFPDATVGGLIATNDAGPLRHRYGTPRDLLIGVTLAMADGRLVKAGGTVVKNVAGYDLGKFVSGSFGSLAAIVDATFKLLPLPRASATALASYSDPRALARDATALADSQIEPTALDLRVSEKGGYQLLLRLTSSPAATDAQMREARQRLSTEAEVVLGDDEDLLWREQVVLPWAVEATVLRCSWLPSRLEAVLACVRQLRESGCAQVVFTGRLAGTGLIRLQGDLAVQVAAIAGLRAGGTVGHVVVLRAPRALKEQIDVWGPEPSAASAVRALKRMFDPAGILNAGRGPIQP
jgi:glycolate oxidase FAD binding subunit